MIKLREKMFGTGKLKRPERIFTDADKVDEYIKQPDTLISLHEDTKRPLDPYIANTLPQPMVGISGYRPRGAAISSGMTEPISIDPIIDNIPTVSASLVYRPRGAAKSSNVVQPGAGGGRRQSRRQSRRQLRRSKRPKRKTRRH